MYSLVYLRVISFSFYLLSDSVFISLGAVPIHSPQSYSPTVCKNRQLKKSAYCANLHNARFMNIGRLDANQVSLERL
ncbi:Uncharacterized protein APZ42_005596 [Daphnia magna]|uniref:Secreted protein n=1 Tax=Daphnia magna TaxID=35525 RepID=A0A162D4V9_9CRUS|nr:Uncharacterized protein APZ42_005596 [Daphnia magna]